MGVRPGHHKVLRGRGQGVVSQWDPVLPKEGRLCWHTPLPTPRGCLWAEWRRKAAGTATLGRLSPSRADSLDTRPADRCVRGSAERAVQEDARTLAPVLPRQAQPLPRPGLQVPQANPLSARGSHHGSPCGPGGGSAARPGPARPQLWRHSSPHELLGPQSPGQGPRAPGTGPWSGARSDINDSPSPSVSPAPAPEPGEGTLVPSLCPQP